MTQASYRKQMRRATWLAFGGAVPLGIAAGGIAQAGQAGGHFWIIFPALLLVGGLGLLISIPWWRRMDDMQRQAQTTTWYWGGTIGAIAVIMALIAGTGVHSEVTKGAMLVLMGQCAAFLIGLAIWRLRHRGDAV